MKTYEQAVEWAAVSSFHKYMGGEMFWLTNTTQIAWIYEVPEKKVQRAVETAVRDMIQAQADHVRNGE